MKPPIFRSVSWSVVVFQLALVGAFAAVINVAFGIHNFLVAWVIAVIGHAIIYRIIRAFLASEHRRGIRLVRAGRFAEAAPLFEASYARFSKRSWLDRYRWLFIGSASSMSYREMALCNAAFCYSQTGDGRRAMTLYEQALREFPGSSMATTALNMLRSVQQPSVSAGENA